MKYFIITVDTEGDNLWSYHKEEEVKTQNSFYIPRSRNFVRNLVLSQFILQIMRW